MTLTWSCYWLDLNILWNEGFCFLILYCYDRTHIMYKNGTRESYCMKGSHMR